jgi:hypothetical protein
MKLKGKQQKGGPKSRWNSGLGVKSCRRKEEYRKKLRRSFGKMRWMDGWMGGLGMLGDPQKV